ncbi:hypothetical protein BBB56_22075 [Candidatus Pantoea deserta]|uniref:Protein CopB n=1 Tax=Candidatus Pantoea deserta TaxID=1869313 RepID=A0A3N4P265_9GAMM|nr:hypothetical protein BBB56_22075 [Pantoea deserta]
MIKLCEADGLTQAEVLERLIENETKRMNNS